MKKYSIQLLILLITALSIITSCTKEGPMGPAGKDGVDGADGADGRNGRNGTNGNANVRMYEFVGPYNFGSTSEVEVSCSSSPDSTRKSVWTGYLIFEYGGDEYTFQVPGRGAYTSTEYNLSIRQSGGNALVRFVRVSAGGETYAKIRMFRIFANTVGKGVEPKYNGYTEAELKAMDYATFTKAMNIK